MKHLIFKHLMLWGAVVGLLGAIHALAQSAGEDPAAVIVEPVYEQEGAENYIPLSRDALEELVGPIALYPDDLIAIALAASAYPLQIVQAARYLEAVAEGSSLEPDENWDDAVVALLNYPQVIELMNEDLYWTWQLGEAVVYQQAEVMDAIQAFRDRAYAAGNLETDRHQVVSYERDVIRITPVERDVIYVPYYEPQRVVVYQRSPVYYYYPDPCPVYYYPYSYGYSFRSGYFWGLTSAFTLGWHTRHLHVHHYYHDSHPYYGQHYYNHHYLRRHEPRHHRHQHSEGRQRGLDPTRHRDHGGNHAPNFVQSRDGDIWQPGPRHGARPGGLRAGERGDRRNRQGRENSDSKGDVRLSAERDPRRQGREKSDSKDDAQLSAERNPRPRVRVRNQTNLDTSSETDRDTNRTARDTTRTDRDTTRSDRDTNRSARDSRRTANTTESVRRQTDSDSDAQERARTTHRAVNPSNDTFSIVRDAGGERVTRQTTPRQLSRTIRDSKRHAAKERRETSTASTSRQRDRTDNRTNRDRRTNADDRAQTASTGSSTRSKSSSESSRSEDTSTSRRRDDERTSTRRGSKRRR